MKRVARLYMVNGEEFARKRKTGKCQFCKPHDGENRRRRAKADKHKRRWRSGKP